MKRIFCLVLAVSICIGVYAEPVNIGDIVSKLPALKQGVAYSLLDNDFNHLSTLEVASFKDVSLELGYSTKDKFVGVISYEVANLKDMGVDIPVLDLVTFNVGIYGGVGRINISGTEANNEFDYGISATLIDLKW